MRPDAKGLILMDNDGLAERLAQIERRLSRIESQLGLDREVQLDERGVEVPVTASPVPFAPQVVAPPPIIVQPAQSIGAPSPQTPAEWSPSTAARVASPPLPAFHPTYRTPVTETLETKVGLKWAGWAGAIIVVIGAALGVKYAYDQNWFGALPPAARLVLLSLGGFALLGVGEVVYRRIGALASAGLFGAGIATLFIVSFAGHLYFHLYDRQPAFAFMGVVTLLGAAVSLRANLVSIAVLAVVGASIAPVILYDREANVAGLLTYLLAIQLVAVGLAWWGREPKWWTLRGVGFAVIALWMIVPVISSGDLSNADRRIVLIFSFVYAAVFQGELVLSSLQSGKRAVQASPFVSVPRETWATFSLIVTAALTVAMLRLTHDLSPQSQGVWTIALAACCAGLGIGLSQLARQHPAAASLAVGYRVQAAALVVVAVPVALSGMWITIAWAVLALAFAGVGAALNLNVSRVAAVVVWALAGAYLALWTITSGLDGAPRQTWLDLFDQPLPAYFVLAAVMAVVGHTIAVIIRRSGAKAVPDSTAPAAAPAFPLNDGMASLAKLTDFAAIFAFHAAAYAALPQIGLTLAMLCYGWVLIGFGQVVRSSDLLSAGLSLALLAGGKWLIYDTLGQRVTLGRAFAAKENWLNPQAAIGAALFVTAVGIRAMPLRRLPSARVVRAASGFGAVLIALWLATMEIDRHFEMRAALAATDLAGRDLERAKMVAVSILWSVYAVGCVVGGFAMRISGLRYFGLALFGLTVVKVMFVDLSDVGRGYRILSFLGLGLLLLGTSVLYGKLSPRLLQQRSEPADGEPAAER